MFTPYAVRPIIKNREAIAEAIEREHPRELREQGIGGRTFVFFLLDEGGHVDDIRPGIVPEGSGYEASSGYESLDEAAYRVARIYEFTPALGEGGEPVPVWIQLPVIFPEG